MNKTSVIKTKTRVYKVGKKELKNLLAQKTKCTIQHNGWCCGTCFFAIDESLTNEDWQSLLYFRGDYEKSELGNLPMNINESIRKIKRLCE